MSKTLASQFAFNDPPTGFSDPGLRASNMRVSMFDPASQLMQIMSGSTGKQQSDIIDSDKLEVSDQALSGIHKFGDTDPAKISAAVKALSGHAKDCPGGYTLTPHLDADNKIVYYSAYKEKNGQIAFLVGPDNVQAFKQQAELEVRDKGPKGPGHIEMGSKARTLGFMARHPVAAYKIGKVSKGSTNISTNAVRFSTRIGLHENDAHEGSQVNAFRHTLWQAEIASEFGSEIAKEIGYAHEENPYTIFGSNLNTTFTSLSKADETVDLLNNIIGRRIGEQNKDADMQELALKVLEQYRQHGLWVAQEEKDDEGNTINYHVKLIPLSDKQYQEALKVIKKLNEDGFTEGEQKTRDEQAKRQAEEYMREARSIKF